MGSVRNAFFNEFVNPLMRECGFERDRRIFRRFNERRDCVFVEFQTVRSFGGFVGYKCYVIPAVAPRPWLEWHASGGRPVDFDRPDQTLAFHQRLAEPDTAGRGDSHLWIVDSVESVPRVGSLLVKALRPWLEELSGMLDRDHLVTKLREQADYPFGSPIRPRHPALRSSLGRRNERRVGRSPRRARVGVP
jgi:hypothetical protein